MESEIKKKNIELRNENLIYTEEKSTTSFNWMEKLKPSNKNKLIVEKYRNLKNTTLSSSLSDNNNNNSKDSLMQKEKIKGTEIKNTLNNNDNLEIKENSIKNENSSNNTSKEILHSSPENNKSYLDKWNKCIFENKLNLMELNNLTEKNEIFMKNDINQTVLSDDLENINNIMEEKIKINLKENGFLKQLYHSIMPFFLIQNKEVHRMCLSDYELKLFYKTYNKKKTESERKNPYESYRQGIIKFYKGKYLEAYSHFKSAHIKKENDLNVAKWLAFTSLILLFCSKSIDFTNIRNMTIDVEKSKENDNINSEDNLNFYCCSSRKTEIKTKASSILKNNNFFITRNNNNNSNYLEGCLGYNSNITKISQANLAKEIMRLLKKLLKKENKNLNLTSEKNLTNKTNNSNINSNFNLDSEYINTEEGKNYSHEVETWYMYMLVSTFCEIHKDQNIFEDYYDPKYCIKKIKDIDPFFSYLAYSEYNYILDSDYEIETILKQLMKKYPHRIETFLKYWQLLTKGKLKNLKLAYIYSEAYWKNSSIINLEDNIY